MNYNVSFNSVEDIPSLNASAAFTVSTSEVFKEQQDTTPQTIADGYQYMPWGADNQLPYRILELIDSDETLSTCQLFNAEVCYGSGLMYNTQEAASNIKNEVEGFLMDNDLASYFLGVCQDIKHFAFCVSVIILNADGSRIVRILRKEACYCRFAPAQSDGRIPYILYANWRKSISRKEDVEKIELLNQQAPWADLQERLQAAKGKRPKTATRKFAIVSRVPTPDSTYYPIPYYGALFKGNWYNIKKLIGIAKEAKLKNSAPIKYHIEIANRFWDGIFKAEGITDRKKQQDRVVEEKEKIINFLTGMENSGKVLFSTFYINPNGDEQHDVVINKVETDKEGGDWSTDIIEAVNMVCFTMRVHSNLVGSVPGKTQTNNSGSDKRELYTIAQALQKPYHDLLFTVHKIIISYNGWTNVTPQIPFIQLTTLDENKDAKQVTIES
ncbi:hypothetical protein [Prevotella sp. MA2016]|uniref:hypothetical protein n=1 Tax=Prevotella sp. MA2016 TaxID=1408310 RepID=UPI000A9D1507|nr:hypothetical protein [Prevotella sp. MA2016]